MDLSSVNHFHLSADPPPATPHSDGIAIQEATGIYSIQSRRQDIQRDILTIFAVGMVRC